MRWFLGISLSLLTLTGCTRPEGAEKHIQYSFWGSVLQQKTEEKIVRDFEAEHPHIKVDLLCIGSRYADKIQAMMVGDAAPDVIMVESVQYRDWASRGVLLDVTEDMRALERDLTLMPVPRRLFDCAGHFYALPVNCHGLAMYCNLQLLAQAGIPFPSDGITWDQLADVAPKLARRAGNPDAPTDYAMIMPLPLILLWAYGGDLFDNPFHPTRVIVNSPESARVIEYMRRLSTGRLAVPPDVAADQGTYQLFRDGKIAFFFSGRWSTPDLAGKTKFDWDVAPIPAGPVRRVTQHGGTGLAVWSKSRHPDEARAFLRYYASKRGQEISMLGGRYVPVWRELAFGKEFLALRPPPGLRRFPETMEADAARFSVYTPGASEVAPIVAARMEQVIAQPEVPASQILSGLEAELNRWLAKYKRKSGS